MMGDMTRVVRVPGIAEGSDRTPVGSPTSPEPSRLRLVVSGATAGALAALAFAVVHALWITDITFSLVPMMIAGALCGATIAWSYGRLFTPSVRTWLGYNASYVISLAVLGLVSVAVFEPRTTMAELLTMDGPPTDLIGDAFPLTIAFTLATAATLGVLFGRTLVAFGATLVTCSVLMALLGLDISIIGLVQIPASSLYVVVELTGLIVVLAGSFAVIVIALAWSGLGARSHVPA
jgi:hypothetical protein